MYNELKKSGNKYVVHQTEHSTIKLAIFSESIYFGVLPEKDAHILISPNNSLENTDKKWMMLKK